jgi:hypothetical protein
MTILKTLRKDSLPRGWQHPLGPQTISEFLSGVSGGADEPLWFWRLGNVSAAPSTVVGVIDALDVWLKRGNPWAFSDRGSDHVLWTIHIGCIPSAPKSKAKPVLEDYALPRLRNWLLAPRSDLIVASGSSFLVRMVVPDIEFCIRTKESGKPRQIFLMPCAFLSASSMFSMDSAIPASLARTPSARR